MLYILFKITRPSCLGSRFYNLEFSISVVDLQHFFRIRLVPFNLPSFFFYKEKLQYRTFLRGSPLEHISHSIFNLKQKRNTRSSRSRNMCRTLADADPQH
jgi:hypothetical protein